MPKFLKVALKIIGVFAIFSAIFLGNLWYKTNDIESAKKIKNTLDPVELELCEKQTSQYSMYLGCIDEEFGVGSYALYLSTSMFVFLALLLFKPGIQYLFLTPMFIITWMLLGQLVIMFFNIPMIHVVPMEGDVRVIHSAYFQFNTGNGLVIFFIFFVGAIAGLVAYEIAPWIRKFFITSHNSA